MCGVMGACHALVQVRRSQLAHWCSSRVSGCPVNLVGTNSNALVHRRSTCVWSNSNALVHRISACVWSNSNALVHRISTCVWSNSNALVHRISTCVWSTTCKHLPDKSP
eukprot:5319330-Pyramimonas_sp.AAC.1